MSQILLFALGSAIYPLMLAAVLIMLDAPRPLPLLVGYLTGGMIVSIGLGIVILVIVDDSGAVSGSTGRTTRPWADIVFGMLSLLIALWLHAGWKAPFGGPRPRRRRTKKAEHAAAPPDPSWMQRVLARGSFRLAFLVGMAFSLPSVYYLAALKDIAYTYGTSAEAIGVILAFNIIQFLIIELVLLGYIARPEGAKKATLASKAWAIAHAYGIAEVAALVIGVFLVTRGITDLA